MKRNYKLSHDCIKKKQGQEFWRQAQSPSHHFTGKSEHHINLNFSNRNPPEKDLELEGVIPRCCFWRNVIKKRRSGGKKSWIRHVLNEERTGFELGPQSIYGLIGRTEALSAILFTNRLPFQSIHKCFAVPYRNQFSPRLEHGEFGNLNPFLYIFLKILIMLLLVCYARSPAFIWKKSRIMFQGCVITLQCCMLDVFRHYFGKSISIAVCRWNIDLFHLPAGYRVCTPCQLLHIAYLRFVA